MATGPSRTVGDGTARPDDAASTAGGWRVRRRQQTVEEALDHAVDVMAEHGVGALTISEVARRMGMRGPSLYKYFDSLHSLYDALFARGLAANDLAVREAIVGVPAGVEAIRAGTRATVRWCVENPALAQLLYWRVVPGFEPSSSTFAASHGRLAEMRAMFTEAVRRKQVAAAADSDDSVRLLTVLISGLITQQMANQPGVSYDEGAYTSMTDEALDLLLSHHQRTSHRKGQP